MERLTGNQLWKLRTKHGRDKLFSSGAILREEAIKYFDWCDRHPWLKTELVKYKGDFEEAEVPLGRPYTVDGLTVYLGVAHSYFRSAKGNIIDKRERARATAEDLDVLDAIEWIEQVVRTQQVEGAAVGVFNTNLVARLNGIADNVNQNSTGEAVLRVTVRDQATADNLDALEDLL